MTEKTHRTRVFEALGWDLNFHPSIKQIAEATGVPVTILQEVYNRGVGAWKTNPQSVRLKGSFIKDASAPRSARLGKEQWGLARIYSFLDGGTTFYTADADLARLL